MVSIELALRLREAGLPWRPALGDRFVIADRDMDDQVFVVSDMTIEVHEFDTGSVVGFNGTTEWALDSIGLDDALWLPREDQLREALGPAFTSLHRADGRYRVVLTDDGADSGGAVEGESPEQAYGLAVLQVLGAR